MVVQRGLEVDHYLFGLLIPTMRRATALGIPFFTMAPTLPALDFLTDLPTKSLHDNG